MRLVKKGATRRLRRNRHLQAATAFLFTLFVYARPLCLILTSFFALDPTKSHSCIFSTYLGHVSRFAKADSDKETKEEQVDDLRKTVEFLIMLPLLLWK